MNVGRGNSLVTIGKRLDASAGYSSGWDYLRVALASGVLIVHSLPISHGEMARFTMVHPWLWPVAQSILPSFFALSGFLVSASLLRVSIPRFVALRILRIWPALMVEVFLSALILGPLFTTVPLAEYFSSEMFQVYFRNTYGDIHYYLPGVFLTNPYPGVVNGSLWTVPFELECYLAIVVLGLLRFVRLPLAMVGTMALATAGVLYLHWNNPAVYGWVDGRMLVLFFLAGVALFSWRDYVPLRLDLFIVMAAFSAYATTNPHALYLSPLPVAYCTVWIGTRAIPKLPLLFTGDYSYGIYLYAFPIQQTVFHLAPAPLRVWYWNAPISLCVVALFAAFSWWCVERPVLTLKRFVKGGHLDKRDAQFEKEPAAVPQYAPSGFPAILAGTLGVVMIAAAVNWSLGTPTERDMKAIEANVEMHRYRPEKEMHIRYNKDGTADVVWGPEQLKERP